jgi:hypothetical protein
MSDMSLDGVETAERIDAPAPDATQTQAPADAGSILSASDQAPAAPVDGAKPDPTGDPWYKALAGEDPKASQLLARYAGPDSFMKAHLALQQKLRSGEVIPKLDANATPEQRAAYNKALGIPDDPGQYTIEVPADRPLNEVEKAVLEDYRKDFHRLGIAPSAAKELTAKFLQIQDAQMQAWRDHDLLQHEQNDDALRAEWGRDYRSKVNAVNNLLAERLGSKADELLNKQFVGGGRLGNDMAFIKFCAEIAGERHSEIPFDAGQGAGGQSIDDQIAELHKMQVSDDPKARKEYWSDAIQDKMSKLYLAKERRGSR